MTRDQIQLHPGLFQAILDDPADDEVRLVYADWLDDQEDHQRAEFVRVGCELSQLPECLLTTVDDGTGDPGGHVCRCHWHTLRHRERELLAQHWPQWTSEAFGTKKVSLAGNLDSIRVVLDGAELDVAYRRGFVSTVRLPLEVFIGRVCESCGGQCTYYVSGGGRNRGKSWEEECPDCHGRGRTDAHGPRLAKAAPLERVEVTPCIPRVREYGGGYETWVITQDTLPFFLFDRLCHGHGSEFTFAEYSTRDEANAAFSDALLTWAK